MILDRNVWMGDRSDAAPRDWPLGGVAVALPSGDSLLMASRRAVRRRRKAELDQLEEPVDVIEALKVPKENDLWLIDENCEMLNWDNPDCVDLLSQLSIEAA